MPQEPFPSWHITDTGWLTYPGRGADVGDAGGAQRSVADAGGDGAAGAAGRLAGRTLELVVSEGAAEQVQP